MNSMQKMLDFLTRLDEAGIAYSLEHNREESITVLASAPAERWEIEYFADGSVEVEVFYSSSAEEGLEDETALERLFAAGEEEEYEYDEDEDDDEEEDDFDEDDFEDDDDYEEEDRLVNEHDRH